MKAPLTERRKQCDIDAISLFIPENGNELPHVSQKLVKPPVTYSIIPVIEPIHHSGWNNLILNNQKLGFIYAEGEIKV